MRNSMFPALMILLGIVFLCLTSWLYGRNGVVSCHYVDSIGFQELPGFLKPENYLKAAEMAMEDDYGMIDGVINNGKKEEPAEKASVLDQLKEKQEAVPPAPPRRCCEEKEL